LRVAVQCDSFDLTPIARYRLPIKGLRAPAVQVDLIYAEPLPAF
jgi:hypothetical protein